MNEREFLDSIAGDDESKPSSRSHPGQWIEPGNDADGKAWSMLQANPNAPAVWVGLKQDAEPKVTVYGRDGRREQISHSPVMSFPDRLAELVCDWPAGDGTTTSGGDDTEAAAQAILNA